MKLKPVSPVSQRSWVRIPFRPEFFQKHSCFLACFHWLPKLPKHIYIRHHSFFNANDYLIIIYFGILWCHTSGKGPVSESLVLYMYISTRQTTLQRSKSYGIYFLNPRPSKYFLYANIFFTKYQLPGHLRYVIGPTLFGRLDTAHSVFMFVHAFLPLRFGDFTFYIRCFQIR